MYFRRKNNELVKCGRQKGYTNLEEIQNEKQIKTTRAQSF